MITFDITDYFLKSCGMDRSQINVEVLSITAQRGAWFLLSDHMKNVSVRQIVSGFLRINVYQRKGVTIFIVNEFLN